MSMYKKLGSAELGLETINSPKNLNFSLIELLPNGRVSARKLYEFLELRKADISRWLKSKIVENQFATENEDYFGFRTVAEGNEIEDFEITPNFAKKLCMMSKSKRGEEARNYFLKCEESLKNKVLAPTPPPISTAEGLLASIQLMVDLEKNQKAQAEQIKKQGEKLLELETEATGVVVDIHTVKDYKTVKELEKDYLGREINYFVNQKFVEARGLSFQEAHRTAWKDYRCDTGFDYAGAKFATKESKQHFLDWLKSL